MSERKKKRIRFGKKSGKKQLVQLLRGMRFSEREKLGRGMTEPVSEKKGRRRETVFFKT